MYPEAKHLKHLTDCSLRQTLQLNMSTLSRPFLIRAYALEIVTRTKAVCAPSYCLGLLRTLTKPSSSYFESVIASAVVHSWRSLTSMSFLCSRDLTPTFEPAVLAISALTASTWAEFPLILSKMPHDLAWRMPTMWSPSTSRLALPQIFFLFRITAGRERAPSLAFRLCFSFFLPFLSFQFFDHLYLHLNPLLSPSYDSQAPRAC